MNGRRTQRMRQRVVEPPLAASRYNHARSLMSPIFPRLKDTLAACIVFKTADALLREDAISFLAEELPQWSGPWNGDSMPPSQAYNDSAINNLIIVSQRLDRLERLVSTEGLALRYHRVLQYQLYSRLEREIAKENKPKAKGSKNSTLAMELFLSHLYAHDWKQLENERRRARRNRLHNKKTAGKRLQVLCDNIGYGILLLGSRTSIRDMQVELHPKAWCR